MLLPEQPDAHALSTHKHVSNDKMHPARSCDSVFSRYLFNRTVSPSLGTHHFEAKVIVGTPIVYALLPISVIGLRTMSPNVDKKNLDSRGDLDLLLDTLRDVDLSGDLYDESVHLDAHGGYCDIFTAKSRKHGNTTVAVKRLRVHILHNKDASKVCRYSN